MTTWSQFRTDLVSLTQGFFDPALVKVVQKDQAQPYAPGRTLCRISINRISGKLVEKRYEPDSDNALELRAVYYYAEKANVQFLFETVSQADADIPFEPAENLAGLIQFAKVNEDTSFIESTDTSDASFLNDDRWLAACVFEARFNVLITLPATPSGLPMQAAELGFGLTDTAGEPVNLGPYEISTGLLSVDMTGEAAMTATLIDGT